MKLQAILEQFIADTQKVSEIARGANYSLIAVCWLMAHENVDTLTDYHVVLIIVLASLLLDFLQYFVRGEMERMHFNVQENDAKNSDGIIDENYDAKPYPQKIKRVSSVLYYLKIISTLLAFWVLIGKMLF